MGTLNKSDKLKVYEKFKEKQVVTEAQIIANQGKLIKFGESEIRIKQLIWDDANTFEDKVIEIVSSFSGISIDTGNLDLATLAKKLLGSVLRDGLLELAILATEGQVTLDTIREHRATKDDVIKIVIESIMLNYSYIKNLITLGQKLG